MRKLQRTLITASLAVGAASAFAGAFTAGNIVVYRTGDGSTAQSGAAAPVFLDEFDASGTLVQSVAMPTTANGNHRQYVGVGNSTTEGMLSRSDNKQFLTCGGYDTIVGTASLNSTTSAAVNRVVGLVKYDGTIDTTTNLTDAYSTSNIRSVCTVDGTAFWMGGNGTVASNGVRYVPYGPGQTSVQLNTGLPSNTRTVGIYNGQLYVSTASNAYQGVNTVGTGLPTTGSQTVTLLPGFDPSTTAHYSSIGFAFADANTLYIADSNVLTGSGGLQKWTFDGSLWSLAYTITAGITPPNGLMGVVVIPDAGGNIVYATGAPTATGGAGPTFLLKAVDTGAGASFSLLSTSPTNEFYHGLALAPESPNLPVVLAPTGFTVGLGSVISGNNASLASDDANPLKLCKAFVPNFASPRMRFDADFLSPYLTPSAVKLDLKARMTTGGSFKVRAFVADRTGGGFVYGAPNQVVPDTTINLTFALYTGNSTNVANNVHTDGTMRSRVEIQQTGFSAVFVPCSELEYLNLTVSP